MKPQVDNRRKRNHNLTTNKGFTLLELIVVSALVAMTTAWAMPEFRRGLEQARVDRYARNVESGLFSLRAKMGANKESCTIDFGNIPSFQTNEYQDASIMLEQKPKLNTSNQHERSASDPLYLCNYTSNDFADLANDSIEVKSQIEARERIQSVAASVQLVGQLNSNEHHKINVASTAQTYTFTPPGTSIKGNSMTLIIQSKEANKPWAKKSDGVSRLVTRCIRATGTGRVENGTWSGGTCTKK